MPKLGRVRYLKAVEGVAGPGEVLGGTRRVATPMQRMWDTIGGTDDAVALYVKRAPRERYNPRVPSPPFGPEFRPEHVGAVLWLPAASGSETVHSHTEDESYEIGCPVAAADTTCGPRLRDLVFRLYGPDGPLLWRRLCGSMTGGKPFAIDTDDYRALSDALTAFYSATPTKP